MDLGEFRKITKDLPDTTEFITVSDNYEMGHVWVKAGRVSVVKVKPEKRHFRDDFDGTPYSADVYVPSDDGVDMLKI